MYGQMIEAQLVSALERMSNGDPPAYQEEWIEEAGEQFKASIRKQLDRQKKDFRLRMSNIGKPLCQIQMEKSDAEPIRRPYNHIFRMMIGDAVEVLTRLYLKVAGCNVTSHGDKVTLDVGDITIKGESDIDIDGRVYDIKSASPWAFRNKFSRGYQALADDDGFGYVGQLYGYADAEGKPAGGWIVADKSSGEIVVVEAEASDKDVAGIRAERKETVKATLGNRPFERCFEAETETYYGKPTGALRLPKVCADFCDYRASCWPEAELRPQPKSRAAHPPQYWYAEYPETENAD